MQDLPDLDRRVDDLVFQLTLAEKIRQMAQYQDAVPRLGLAPYKHGTEAAHGMAWLGEATGFPQPIGLASTWDKALLERVGEAIGTEARGFFARNKSINGLTLWAPTVDLERDPRWGRTEEGYGEDPFLVGHLAGSLIAGLQGRDPRFLRAVATLKHFWGNNQEVDRGVESTNASEAQQRDYYLRSFEIAFREYGAQSMMTSYNSVNGIPANLNPQVNEVVRGQWGWKGFVVSDAGDVLGTKREHGYVDTWAQAVALSVKAGIDSITDDAATVHQALEEALEQGLLTENDLHVALRRTFRVRFLLGEFDAETCPYTNLGEEGILSPAHARLSREATARSVVLLANDGLLPLAAPRRVAVVGPLATEVFRDWYSGSMPYTVSIVDGLKKRYPRAEFEVETGNPRVSWPNGDWELTDWGWGSTTLKNPATGRWLVAADEGLRGDSPEVFGWFTKEVFGVHALGNDAQGRPLVGLTTWNGVPVVAEPAGTLGILSAEAAEAGRIGIDSSAPGVVNADLLKAHAARLPAPDVTTAVERAVQAARRAEVTVCVVGSHPLVTAKETLDRPDIVLPPAQEELVKSVVAANPNTVVVVVSGYPLTSPSNFGGARAVLTVTHAGQELGNAVADVLSGDVNPAGRLPLTWYRSVDDLPPIKDYDLLKGRTYQYFAGPTQFPFGHGLSYTSFRYDDLAISSEGEVEFTLTNTGKRAGDEVVQVYLRPLGAPRPSPRLKLVAFERLHLGTGARRRLKIRIDVTEFLSWNPMTHRRELAAPRFDVLVGASSSDTRLQRVFVPSQV